MVIMSIALEIASIIWSTSIIFAAIMWCFYNIPFKSIKDFIKRKIRKH